MTNKTKEPLASLTDQEIIEYNKKGSFFIIRLNEDDDYEWIYKTYEELEEQRNDK